MDNNIYAKVGPIILCRLKYESGDNRLSYYKNKNLINMISEIGTIYNEILLVKKKHPYSKGVGIIQATLLSQGINVSKKQIRRFVRPNYKNKHVIKLPFQSIEILNVVYNLIHNSSESNYLIGKCKMKKGKECIKCNKANILCRDFLVGDLYKCLNTLRGTFSPKGGATYIVNKLDGWMYNCNL